MSEEKRAQQYAALFTHLEAKGFDWWSCAPVDGRVWKTQRRMRLGDYIIASSEAGRWQVTS